MLDHQVLAWSLAVAVFASVRMSTQVARPLVAGPKETEDDRVDPIGIFANGLAQGEATEVVTLMPLALTDTVS